MSGLIGASTDDHCDETSSEEEEFISPNRRASPKNEAEEQAEELSSEAESLEEEAEELEEEAEELEEEAEEIRRGTEYVNLERRKTSKKINGSVRGSKPGKKHASSKASSAPIINEQQLLQVDTFARLGVKRKLKLPFRFAATAAGLAREGGHEAGGMFDSNNSGHTMVNGLPTVKFDHMIPRDVQGIIESVNILSIHSKAPVTLGVTVNGVKNNTELCMLSAKRSANYVLLPGVELNNVKIPIATCNYDLDGVNFLQKYPGRTLENIDQGVHVLDERFTAVKRDHPMAQAVLKASRNAKYDPNCEYYQVPTKIAKVILKELKSAMEKSVPPVALADLSLSFQRVHTKSTDYFTDPYQIGKAWTDDLQLVDSAAGSEDGTKAAKKLRENKLMVAEGVIEVEFYPMPVMASASSFSSKD